MRVRMRVRADESEHLFRVRVRASDRVRVRVSVSRSGLRAGERSFRGQPSYHFSPLITHMQVRVAHACSTVGARCRVTACTLGGEEVEGHACHPAHPVAPMV